MSVPRCPAAATRACTRVPARPCQRASRRRDRGRSPRPRRSAAAGSAVQMRAAFIGSAALERERAISTVSSSSARVELPSDAGPAARGRHLERHDRLVRGRRLERDVAVLRPLRATHVHPRMLGGMPILNVRDDEPRPCRTLHVRCRRALIPPALSVSRTQAESRAFTCRPFA